MVDFVYNLHSGWRYLVIAATIFVAVYFLYALTTKNTTARQETSTLRFWTIIVDTQVLLGIILILLYIFDDNYSVYSELHGHWTTMIIAMLVVHVPAFYRRFNGEPTVQARRIMGLVLPLVLFALVWMGLAAIDRGLFEMISR